ncbi:hypothetical protein [Salinisphaera sp. T31B1]|uniref:hypothetical protein n=1 Tax=Salinisphaera sp. T31B1 TaxID=727963 RepID=UPI003342AC10
MTHTDRRVSALLALHGRTFAAELGARISRNTPAPLFRLLCLANLSGAPVQAAIAMRAAIALADAGWTTPAKLAHSSWHARVRVLNQAGYARVDEKTATQLSAMVATLEQRYNGDLRRLRKAAGGDVGALRRALTGFKGIGDTGAAIFVREMQIVWPECYPFVDRAAAKAAAALGLPQDPAGLASQVERVDFPRLVAALVRAGLARDFDAVRAAADR